MSRFMFEDDDEERNLLGGTPQQEALVYMCANEVMILAGCAQCGARLVHDRKPMDGATVVFAPGTNRQTAVGTPLCAQCFQKGVQ